MKIGTLLAYCRADHSYTICVPAKSALKDPPAIDDDL